MRALFTVMLLAGAACATERSDVASTARSRQVWVAPDADLDSTGLRVSVRDANADTALRALVCFQPAIDTSLTTDSAGVATLLVSGAGNLRARVLARGYRAEDLTFQPRRRGRMQATVLLAPDPTSTAEPSCGEVQVSP